MTEAFSLTGTETTTSGVTAPGDLSSYFGGTDSDEIGIGDPFADDSNYFATFTTKSSKASASDEFGIGDPFADTEDLFSDSSNPFGTIKAGTSSKINSIGSFFPSLAGSSKSSSFADFSSWSSF